MVDIATAPRAGCQSAEGRELTTIVEAAVEALEPENRGDLLADALELQQQPAWCRSNLVLGRLVLQSQQSIARRFDFDDLLLDQLEPVELATNLGLQSLRLGPAVAGLQSLEPSATIPAQQAVAVDPLSSEQTGNPIGVHNPLL